MLTFVVCMQSVVELVVQENTDEVGDLYLDIAEAYMDHGYYEEAKPLLASLVTTDRYNLVSTNHGSGGLATLFF